MNFVASSKVLLTKIIVYSVSVGKIAEENKLVVRLFSFTEELLDPVFK
jgi:hypothetical protein